jgi:DNA polymerase delta subunit 4
LSGCIHFFFIYTSSSVIHLLNTGIISLQTEPTMPTTRRSAASTRSRGPTAKGQSTLSFSNKVTKPVPKNAKKSIISPSVVKIDPSQLTKEREAEDIVDDEPAVAELEPIEVDEEETNKPDVAPELVKSELELQAEKVTDAQIKKYWKSIENQWSTPRLHQQGVSQNERILRYFDVSSQYGVSQLSLVIMLKLIRIT